MNDLFADLSSFLQSEELGIVPWPLSTENAKTSTSNNSCSIPSLSREFYYLKSINGLPSYADDFGFQWTHLYDDYRKDRYKHLEQFMRLGISPESLKGKNCLDVGCGLGRLSEICLGKANYVFGLDMSAAVTEAARLIRCHRFIPVQASADQMPLKDQSFDFVYCWGVLHHTQNPQKTLSELWRVLKPGGTLAIWVYARNSWYLKRSLLAKYFSNFTESEMLSVADTLTTLSHTVQLTSKTYLQMLTSDLCYSVKNTKEYTRHILYDGLGPSFHYLLDSNWFKDQASGLVGVQSFQSFDEPFTVCRISKMR
jgi:ubiquinone/menaquinone biosynthesis C-methylase UbiE